MNTLKTIFLMTVLTIILVFIGQYLAGRQGMITALAFAGGMNLFAYWFSDKLALMSYRARQVSEAEAPELHSIVRGLTTRTGIPMPKIFVIPSSSSNAFATGRNSSHASVAVTEGIMGLLNRTEMEGVLAHELSHIRHRDILIASIVATLAGAITMIARMAGWAAMSGGYGGRDNDRDSGGGAVGFILMAILAPLAALLVQMWISRTREYEADAGGAEIAGNPYGLADALEKLQRGAQVRPIQANPSSAHMFIVNPLSGKSLMSLFSTHPPIEQRVAKLRAMGRG